MTEYCEAVSKVAQGRAVVLVFRFAKCAPFASCDEVMPSSCRGSDGSERDKDASNLLLPLSEYA